MEAILAAAGTTPATVTISVCFGCPFEGRVDPGVVAELAARFAGRAEVVLADTIGVATPRAVRALVERTGAEGFHGHNTRNTGLCELPRRARGGRARARRVRRRSRRLPVRARARPATSRPRISSICSRARAIETGVDLDALIAVSQLARKPARREARGLRLSRGRRRARLGAGGARRRNGPYDAVCDELLRLAPSLSATRIERTLRGSISEISRSTPRSSYAHARAARAASVA